MAFELVCQVSDLAAGTASLAEVGGKPVAMVRVDSGDIHAIEDTCSHGAVSLSEGEVSGCFVECWLHGSRFDLRTGAPVTPPATAAVAVYPVKVEGDDVYVDTSMTTNL